jgi:hypothetical protein
MLSQQRLITTVGRIRNGGQLRAGRLNHTHEIRFFWFRFINAWLQALSNPNRFSIDFSA